MQSLFIEVPLVESFLLLANKLNNQAASSATTQSTSIPNTVFIKCEVYNTNGELIDTSRTENKSPSGYRLVFVIFINFYKPITNFFKNRKQDYFQVALRVSNNNSHRNCFSLFADADIVNSLAWQVRCFYFIILYKFIYYYK